MHVIGSIQVSNAEIEAPSPWWLKGGAIFVGVLGLSSLLGAVSLAFSGIVMDSMVDSLDSEELCAEDPEREECEEFIDSISQMSEMPLWDVGAAFSALLFLLSIPTALLMWSAEDRKTALALAWGWVGFHAVSQLYMVHSYMSWSDQFYDSIPMDEMQWVAAFTKIASYGGVLFCEAILAAGLVLISYKTRPPTRLEVPSAFHLSEE